MTPAPRRFGSVKEFRAAVAQLGLPASDDEVSRLWEMVTNLYAQANALHEVLDAGGRRAPLGDSHVDGGQ